ncbi:hypothetical protein ACFC4G_47690 [Streptomyces sp. NPDC056002]
MAEEEHNQAADAHSCHARPRQLGRWTSTRRSACRKTDARGT